MARITRAAAHLTVEEVKQRMQTEPHPGRRQRWLVIYHALVDPSLAQDIAKHCGVSKASVHQVISTYQSLWGGGRGDRWQRGAIP